MSLKVLVAGMPNLENQFGRSLRKYGVEVFHTDIKKYAEEK